MPGHAERRSLQCLAPSLRTPIRGSRSPWGRIELTPVIERVYDALMPTLWRVRPFVCLLLAVSTVIGAVAPVRACACLPPPRTPAPSPETPNEPAVTSVSAPTPCCNLPCCAANRGARTAGCCCEAPAPSGEARPDTPKPDREGGPAGSPKSSSPCDCDRGDGSSAPAAPAAPATPASDPGDYATVSPVPTVLLAEPPTAASRVVRLIPAGPPTNLVISLSRLTC
jgi:hypothetical protein